MVLHDARSAGYYIDFEGRGDPYPAIEDVLCPMAAVVSDSLDIIVEYHLPCHPCLASSIRIILKTTEQSWPAIDSWSACVAHVWRQTSRKYCNPARPTGPAIESQSPCVAHVWCQTSNKYCNFVRLTPVAIELLRVCGPCLEPNIRKYCNFVRLTQVVIELESAHVAHVWRQTSGKYCNLCATESAKCAVCFSPNIRKIACSTSIASDSAHCQYSTDCVDIWAMTGLYEVPKRGCHL